MWIIEYVNSHNITVQFEDGYVAKGRCYLDFKNGKIKSPYDKSIFGNNDWKDYKNVFRGRFCDSFSGLRP